MKNKLSLVCIVLAVLVESLMMTAAAQVDADQPDLTYEAKLYDIFLNYHNTKTSEAEWQALVGDRQAERYSIQAGDSLWDISKTIFGDGNYWPKIWSLNSEIENPHFISINNSIRFLLGDESSPPVFTVTENLSEEGLETNRNAQVNESEVEPEIPEPLRKSRPVVKKLPPSLPAWQDVALQDNFDEFGISYVRRKILDVEDTVQLPSFIAETVPDSFGIVKEIEVGSNIASSYQYIYVAMKPGRAQVGDSYLVVSNKGPLKSAHSSIRGFLGYSIDVQGEVQLVEKVAGKDEAVTGEIFRALVLKIVNPVAINSVLIEGQIERIKISEEGPRSQVVAQIIGGSFFNKRQVYGNESIAYLNRGELDGLMPGQILPIRANLSIRKPDTVVHSNVRPIGWARVLKTTPRFSTIVIVRAWSDVLSGDVTGSGELLPQITNKTKNPESESVSSANLNEELLESEEDPGQPNTNQVEDFNSEDDFGADE